jgi:hypothetical protein
VEVISKGKESTKWNGYGKEEQKKENSIKKKPTPVQSLQGNPVILFEGKQYGKLIFDDGKCINCLREILNEELSTKFIKENSIYKLHQC